MGVGFRATLKTICFTLVAISFSACGGGSGSGDAMASPGPALTPNPGSSAPPNAMEPPVEPPVNSVGAGDNGFADDAATSRFLSQATFGPGTADIETLAGSSASTWFIAELGKPASSYLERVERALTESGATDPSGQPTFQGRRTPNRVFWEIAGTADDQLRQRMVFALSQLLVISNADTSLLFDWPIATAYYQDVLSTHALGNYRDLLEAVTYSPAMGAYLTYIQNARGDPALGRTPDENYAREIMQLFSIGLVDLASNGEPVLASGVEQETYNNSDVTGLARVFTGLSLDTDVFFFGFAELNSGAQKRPMRMFSERHSALEKRFLGTVIPPDTSGADSIDIALDTLVSHPNTAPFLARQLIQRFTASSPSPSYVERVAGAFAAGTFTLPNGASVGDGRRGDLAATLAAVLFDRDARSDSSDGTDRGGKLREPILRVTHWLRAFDADALAFAKQPEVWNTAPPDRLAQGPFQSPSVFNFYRPGYVAPGTQSGAAGLTAPELQIVSSTTVASYSNAIDSLVFSTDLFAAGYATELALADDPATLIDHLNVLLCGGQASDRILLTIQDFISEIPPTAATLSNADGEMARVQYAVFMFMTSPDYIFQH